MEMEVIAFYPDVAPDSGILGTAHVHVFSKEDPIIDFDIRGVLVFICKGKLITLVPGRKQIDPKTKKMVKFSTFTFSTEAVQKRLQDMVKTTYLNWKKEHPEFKEHELVGKTKRAGSNPNKKPIIGDSNDNTRKPYRSSSQNTVAPKKFSNVWSRSEKPWQTPLSPRDNRETSFNR